MVIGKTLFRMLDRHTSNQNDDDQWNNATGEAVSLLEPLGGKGPGSSQDSRRKATQSLSGPIDSSDQQATVGIALYAICTLCSSGEPLSAGIRTRSPRPLVARGPPPHTQIHVASISMCASASARRRLL